MLAPALSSADVIKALRQHVYACFTRPLDYEEVADMARAAIEDANWRDGIEVTSGLPYWITLRVLPPDDRRPADALHDRIQRRRSSRTRPADDRVPRDAPQRDGARRRASTLRKSSK